MHLNLLHNKEKSPREIEEQEKTYFGADNDTTGGDHE